MFFSFLATKVSIEKKNALTNDELTKLQGLYKQMLGPAIDIYRKDVAERGKNINDEVYRKKDMIKNLITSFIFFRVIRKFFSKK